MDVDSRIVKNGQIVNHFRKANNITTKVSDVNYRFHNVNNFGDLKDVWSNL